MVGKAETTEEEQVRKNRQNELETRAGQPAHTSLSGDTLETVGKASGKSGSGQEQVQEEKK